MASPPSMFENGILLVNKPVGLSSAALVSRVKKLSGAKKAGHAGTLDPFADGLMVLGINKGTRLSRFFLTGEKSYIATVTYGLETDTLDGTGQTIKTCDPDFFSQHPDFFSEDFQKGLLKGFLGPQEQIPPVYSALKHQGVPLYKLARKGTPVQKEPRSIVIHELNFLDMEPPNIRFSVTCSGGTYIRTLAADLGTKAGCFAHLSALTRTGCCGFSLDQAVDLDTLYETPDITGHLMSMDRALPEMAAADASDSLVQKIKHGMPLNDTDMPVHPGFVKVRDPKGAVIAIVEWDNQKACYNYCCVFPD